MWIGQFEKKLHFHKGTISLETGYIITTGLNCRYFPLEGIMFSAKKIGLLYAFAVAVLLSSTACLFSPDQGDDPGTSGFYTPADSAWKVLANLQLAYTTRNYDAYVDCLDDEFEFILLEVDWKDYDGDGLIDESWGRDLEEEYTGNMFSSPEAEIIELTLTGNSETPFYGDSTGVTLQLVRVFSLKVYFFDSEGFPQGFQAQGDAIFRCRPDENGEYKIWQWEDHSET
jgi:hypothetical protein